MGWREDNQAREREETEQQTLIRTVSADASKRGHTVLWCAGSAECATCGASGAIVADQPGMPPGKRGPFSFGGSLAAKKRCGT